MFALLDSAWSWFEQFASSPWFYLVIFIIAMLDSVIPVVPSETMVIIGGVAAGSGGLDGDGHALFLPLVIVSGALGAFIGDHLSYFIGNSAADKVTARYGHSDKGRKRLEWATRHIRDRGGLLLVTARFVPGGRTLVTLTCGITNQHRSWFMKWVVVAASIWATYAALLGFIGGKTFADNHARALILAFSLALSVTLIIEVVRFVLKRRGDDIA